jgi:hypothetical protein
MTAHTGLTWRKSSYSERQNNCVETTTGPAAVYVRDSKLGEASPILSVTPGAWAGFASAIQAPTG